MSTFIAKVKAFAVAHPTFTAAAAGIVVGFVAALVL